MGKDKKDILLEQYTQITRSSSSEQNRFSLIVLSCAIVFGALVYYLSFLKNLPEIVQEKSAQIRTSFIIEEKRPEVKKEVPKQPVKTEEKKIKVVEKKEPVDLTQKPPVEEKPLDVPAQPETPPPDAPAKPVRKVYGLRKVYSTGIGASGESSDAIIGKLGNTLNTAVDTFKATSEELKGRVVSIATVTTYPTLKSVAKPEYTKEMLEHKIEGTVRVKILIDVDGKVKQAIVLDDLGFGSKEKVYEACLKLTFEPATQNGEPVAAWQMFTFRFEMIQD